jgi:predicted NAD/FAD-binding protein
MRVAIIGAGWAGMAAGVEAVAAGHAVSIFEAARTLGGRARALPVRLPDGRSAVLDNGQHILIGAYSETLRLMRRVGVDPATALLRLPLRMQFPDGGGLRLPDWPAPLDALAGMATARGWTLADKWSLLRTAHAWQRSGFACEAQDTVADLCHALPQGLKDSFIDPLCVAALNTPADQASGQVFLRVLQDSLFGGRGSSDLLLPRQDLGQVFPQAALEWLQAHGALVRLGQRVQSLGAAPQGQWLVGRWRTL